MQPISIRAAGVADAASVAALAGELGYPCDAETMRSRLRQLRDERAGAVFVAVDAHGRILGWTHVAPRLSLEEAPCAELIGLIVADGARGSGVGAQLLRAAEAWARDHGHAKLRVRSNVVRERAHRFYRREGYAERKRQAVFDKALD